jgi:hypothetical protein
MKVILIFALITSGISMASLNEYPEITTEEYSAFRIKYIEEKDPDVKAHYDAILRPERFDKNKDRKISRNEIREAILYVIYPKQDSKKVDIPADVDRHFKSQVDLFINNLNLDFMNPKQFSSLLMKISANNFVHAEMVRRGQEAKSNKLDESEGEL